METSGHGQTQRDIGRLEGKMDMLIGMVGNLTQKMDAHITSEDLRVIDQDQEISKLDKRIDRIESKWALLTGGAVLLISGLWKIFIFAFDYIREVLTH